MVVKNSSECLTDNGTDGTLTREECNLFPKASLICRPNSHPFQDRVLQLDQPIKVGRSVARARPVNNNAIFDCKVLSRNHALLWYENGKFFLQDTKSCNGTFVNNQRLSKGSEESPPREVCSGDILQFGVDVMENSQKVTHGCIISTLRLFLPDGKEAKASPTIVNTTAETSIPTQDLYQLNQYIQESLAREQILENKLRNLVKLVQDTETASSSGWKALMDEDRLLTRVEILEGQLTTYGKNMNEEKLREEAKRLMEEKEAYQRTAKDTLKKLVDEKLEALKNLKEVEKSFKNAEDELASLKVLYDRVLEENRNLSVKITELQDKEVKEKVEEDKIVRRESLYSEDIDGVFDESVIENCSDVVKVKSKLNIGDVTERIAEDLGESLDGTQLNQSGNNEHALDMNKMMEEVENLTHLVDELQISKMEANKQIMNLNLNLEECQNEDSATLEELSNTKQKLVDVNKLVTEKEEMITGLESGSLFKTALCRHWVNKGSCQYGDRCNFAHGEGQLKAKPPESDDSVIVQKNPLYKTMLCNHFKKGEYCEVGEKCHFAHGKDELRPVPYKVSLCKKFAATGECEYGESCQFAHGEVELQRQEVARDERPPGKIGSQYKTVLCKNWVHNNACEYGDMCLFAHGEDQLKPYGSNDPAYKTVMCKNWNTDGACKWGDQFFHHEVPRSKLPQGVAAEDLVAKMEKKIQVKNNDEDSGIFHLFGSKVEVNWALECINFPEELDTSSSSASVAQGPTNAIELVELCVAKIPKAAGIEEVEHLFSRFGLVAQVIKDQTVQSKFYKCYIRMLVSSSDEFGLKVIPEMEDNLTLRGSTLQVSQLKAPILPTNNTASHNNKETQPVKNCKVLEESKIKLLPEASASEDELLPQIKNTRDEIVSLADTSVSKLSPPGWDQVEKLLPSDVTKLSINVQKEPVRRGSLEEFDNLLKLTNLHHENIYDVEDNSYSDKKGKKEKISKDMAGNFIKLFVSGTQYSNKDTITGALENMAEVIDMWIPSSGYSYAVVKLLPKISVSTVLSVSNESVTFRLALDQSMDKAAHYNHPIVRHGWRCSKSRCDTYNVGLECSRCGLQCREGNCRAAIQQVHGVVTKIFNKSRGIVAFMETKTGREDYAFFFIEDLYFASSSHEFEKIVGKYIVFDATSTGDTWEEPVKNIWVCWVVTKATLAPYNHEERSVLTHNGNIQKLEEMSFLNSISDSQNLFLWPTLVESVTSFWAKNLDEDELLNRLEEVHDACLMREVLDEVPEIDGIYGALLASTGKFHRVKVVTVHHIHCIEVLYVDEGCSSTRSITEMRPLPLHLTSLPAAARKYELAGCYPVTDDQSLVFNNYYKGRKWLKKLLMGEEVRATGMVDQGRFLVDCIAAGLHVNTEVLDRGFTTQVLELPFFFDEIVPTKTIVGLY